MDNWLSSLSAWFVDLVKSIFSALLTFVHDAVLWAFDGFLTALAALIAAIPAPSFLSGGLNVGSMLSGMPAFTLFVLNQLNIAACLAVISAGITFRLIRKFTTLFQW